MVQVGARIIARRRTRALRIERRRIVRVHRVAQVDRPAPRIGEPVPPVARRQHAIEHVDAAPHGLDQVQRRADTHEVARLRLRQEWQRRIERRQHQVVPLADRETADRITFEIHRDQRFGRAPPQLGIRSALHDAEQRLAAGGRPRRALRQEGGARALRPAQRQLHGALHLAPFRRQLDAFVELHLDVRAEQALDLDRALRRQHVPRAVEVRLKERPLLGDLADLRQAHDLEAARVRQDRLLPAHKRMQPAELGDALRAGPQHEMVGVAEQDIRARVPHLLRIKRLHRRHRADRHERGRADEAARCHDLAAACQPVLGERAIVERLRIRHAGPRVEGSCGEGSCVEGSCCDEPSGAARKSSEASP